MKIVEFVDLINIESNGKNENETSRSNRATPASVGDKIGL